MIRHQLDGVTQVPGSQYDDPTEMLLGFGKWAVRYDDFVTIRSQGFCRCSVLKRHPAHPMAVLAPRFIEGRAMGHHRVQLLFRNPVPVVFIDVSEATECGGARFVHWLAARCRA